MKLYVNILTVKVILTGVLLLLSILSAWAVDQGAFPAWYTTTANLNIRAAASQNGRKLTTVPKGTRLQVRSINYSGWAEIDYYGRTAYCASRYLTTSESNATPLSATNGSSSKGSSSFGWSDILGLAFGIGIAFVVLSILRRILIIVLGIISTVFYKAYLLISLPFYFLNWLQRFLAKPWFLLYKKNTGSDYANAKKRENYDLLRIPLYILLTPLRFVNAVYYNLVIHCSFELFNYLVEVVAPDNDKEGADNFLIWTVLLPWRVIKYPLWHGSLTFIESCIWTMIDTLLPALTLFHGTDCSAAESITQGPGRVCSKSWYSGVWNVGGGNYAGNGIYFAPKRSTALHYSKGSLIVCRVTLGRTLDLGLAPKYIYDQCGYPNAFGVTEWGLKNGYVTGEWWRGDRGWWEYCMYDWQNRYNHSWRIRPLYVLNLNDKCIQRIPGGMVHWFFRQMVLSDFGDYISKQLDK